MIWVKDTIMTVKEMLTQIEEEAETHPEIMEYEIVTAGWCCSTSNFEIDHNTKEVMID